MTVFVHLDSTTRARGKMDVIYFPHGTGRDATLRRPIDATRRRFRSDFHLWENPPSSRLRESLTGK
jgi:hypothetical protein